MFSFSWKKLCKRAAFVVVPLIMAALLFASCDNSTSNSGIPVNAQQPIITVQPAANTPWNVTTASVNLTVTASVTDGGTLGYQWYSNTSNSTTGGTKIITGGTSDTLTLAKANYTTNGSYYFYVIVTNTNNSVTGTKIASRTSNVATVTVSGNSSVVIPTEIAGFWQTEQSNVANYYYTPDPLGPLFYADSFSVNLATKTLYYYQDTTLETYWAGTIVDLIEQDDDAGEPARLIVQLTDVEGTWWTEPEVGKYFAYSYKNVAGDIVSSAQAYSGGENAKNTGVATIAEAVSEYTADNGYFEHFGTYKKRAFSSPSVLAGMQGIWEDDDDMDYLVMIRGTAYLEFMDDYEDRDDEYDNSPSSEDMLTVMGLIVDCTDTTQTSGVLYVQVLGADTYSDYSNFNYVAVGWKDKTETSITFAISTENESTLSAIKELYGEASDFEEANFSFEFTKK